MNIVWTDEAKSHLKEIYDYYYLNFSEILASEIVENIIQKVRVFEHDFISLGQIEPTLKKMKIPFRYLLENSYKIIYWTSEKEVIISAVFHTSQNPKKLKKLVKK